MTWEMRRLGEIATLVGGGTPDRNQTAYWGGDIPWVTPSDLPPVGTGIASVGCSQEMITERGLRESSAVLLPVDAVLLSSRATIGKLAISTCPLATNQGFVNIVPGSTSNSRFIAWALEASRERIVALASSSTFKEVSRGALRGFKVPVPPRLEQDRIVEILDEADRLRRLHAESEAKAERLVPALFDEMFVTPAEREFWAPESIESWVVQGDGALRTGPFGSALRHSEFVAEGVPVLGIDNVVRNRFVWAERRYITPAKFAELRRYRVQPGDVLVSLMGTVGRTAVVPDGIGDAVNTKHLAAITLDRTKGEPEYLAAALRLDPEVVHQLNAAGRGAIMTGLNLTVIRSLRVRRPPPALQKIFARRLNELRALEDRRAVTRARLDALFDELLRRAFTGELTARWREAHAEEMLAEMEHSSRTPGAPPDAA